MFCMMKSLCNLASSYCMTQESDAVLTMLPASVPRGVFGSCAISGSGGMGRGGGGGGGAVLIFFFLCILYASFAEIKSEEKGIGNVNISKEFKLSIIHSIYFKSQASGNRDFLNEDIWTSWK